MRKWLQVAIPLAGVALVTGLGVVIPAPGEPIVSQVALAGQVSAACPTFDEPTAKTTVAVTGSGPVRIGDIAGDQKDVAPGQVGTATGKQALRLTGLTSSAPSGTSVAAIGSGPSRGVLLTGCVPPATESWLVGVRSDASHLTQIVLVNLDHSEAAVDLTIYGPDGQVTSGGARGIVVGPTTQRIVPLGPLVSAARPVSVRVQTSAGRVAAVAREVMFQGNTAVGTDWAPAGTSGTTAVLPVVSAGTGARELVVANPGDRSIEVRVEALGAQGPVALVGAESLTVPGRATRAVSLQGGLQGQAAAVRVTSDATFAAGLRQVTGDLGPVSDLAFGGVGTQLPGVFTVPVSLPRGAKAAVSLANAGGETASAAVSFTTGGGATVGQSAAVSVVPGGSTQVQVPAGAAGIRIEVTAGALHGGLSVSAQLGRVSALGSYALNQGVRTIGPAGRYDPHAPRA